MINIHQSQQTLSSLLTVIKGKNPDAIIGGGHFADGVLLIKQAKQLNVNAKLFSIVVAAPEDKFRDALGADANYIMGPSQWEPDVKYTVNYGPSVSEFINMYVRRDLMKLPRTILQEDLRLD